MKSIRHPLLAALLCTTFAAHAGDIVIGATVSPTYHTSLQFNDAGTIRKFNSDSTPIPLKLYGGFEFDDHFGIEAGYKDFGKATIDPVRGSGSTLSTNAHAAYVAAKGTWHIDDSWSLFGKLGVTATRAHFAGAAELTSLTTTAHHTGAYASVGAAYAITSKLALTLEYEHVGSDAVKDKPLSFGMNGIAAGLRYAF